MSGPLVLSLFPGIGLLVVGIIFAVAAVISIYRHKRRPGSSTPTSVGRVVGGDRGFAAGNIIGGQFYFGDSDRHDAPFTVTGKSDVLGNGVPLPMGRAIAKAVRQAVKAHP
jgi:hypothetical protein